MSAPIYLTFYILASSIAVLVVVIAGLRAVVARSANAGLGPLQGAAIGRTASLLLVAWYLLAVLLALAGAFRGSPERLPTIELGIFVPVVLGLVLLWRSPIARRLLDATPQSWIVGIQFYRVLGLIFLLLGARGHLPLVFALPAGAGDVAIGLMAPLVAYAHARRVAGREALVLAWNTLGLLDLAVALTTGFLSSPSPLQLLSLQAPNTMISAIPLVIIPVFAVPLALLLHAASLIKLQRDQTHPLANAQAGA